MPSVDETIFCVDGWQTPMIVCLFLWGLVSLASKLPILPNIYSVVWEVPIRVWVLLGCNQRGQWTLLWFVWSFGIRNLWSGNHQYKTGCYVHKYMWVIGAVSLSGLKEPPRVSYYSIVSKVEAVLESCGADKMRSRCSKKVSSQIIQYLVRRKKK